MAEESSKIEAADSSNLSANTDESSEVSTEGNLTIEKISKDSSSNSASNFIDNEDCAENSYPMGNLLEFLKRKGVSDDLKNRLLIDGPTDEMIRLLKPLRFSDRDVKILISLWRSEIQGCECLDGERVECEISSTDDNALSASLYLKKKFNLVLKEALREVLMRKPYDPIEFLGHWLLNFTICQERARVRKEFEDELMAEREKRKEQQLVDNILEFPEYDEAEEFNDDWNFVNYEKA